MWRAPSIETCVLLLCRLCINSLTKSIGAPQNYKKETEVRTRKELRCRSKMQSIIVVHLLSTLLTKNALKIMCISTYKPDYYVTFVRCFSCKVIQKTCWFVGIRLCAYCVNGLTHLNLKVFHFATRSPWYLTPASLFADPLCVKWEGSKAIYHFFYIHPFCVVVLLNVLNTPYSPPLRYELLCSQNSLQARLCQD